jgi:hypothetical protein
MCSTLKYSAGAESDMLELGADEISVMLAKSLIFSSGMRLIFRRSWGNMW